MNLPINEKELEKIIGLLKNSHPELYSKLWSYRMNYMIDRKIKD